MFCKLFIYKIILAFFLGKVYIISTDKPEGPKKSPLLNRCLTSVKAGEVSLFFGVNIQKGLKP